MTVRHFNPLTGLQKARGPDFCSSFLEASRCVSQRVGNRLRSHQQPRGGKPGPAPAGREGTRAAVAPGCSGTPGRCLDPTRQLRRGAWGCVPPKRNTLEVRLGAREIRRSLRDGAKPSVLGRGWRQQALPVSGVPVGATGDGDKPAAEGKSVSERPGGSAHRQANAELWGQNIEPLRWSQGGFL